MTFGGSSLPKIH